MPHADSGIHALRVIAAKILQASIGLEICAFGAYLQLQADVGVAPWESLNQGLAALTSQTYGTICILVSIAVLLANLFMKEPIGVGTILDTLLVGWGVDQYTKLGLVSQQTEIVPQILLLLAGISTICVGQLIYIKAGIGCGPRDSLLIALGRRMPRFSIGSVNMMIMAVVFTFDVLLGSQIGIGTFICTFFTGPIQNIIFRLGRFEPRALQQETLWKTARDIGNALCRQKAGL